MTKITPRCRDYTPSEGSRRCRHYLTGTEGAGSCLLSTRLMCEEWQRINEPGYLSIDLGYDPLPPIPGPVTAPETFSPPQRGVRAHPAAEPTTALPEPVRDPLQVFPVPPPPPIPPKSPAPSQEPPEPVRDPLQAFPVPPPPPIPLKSPVSSRESYGGKSSPAFPTAAADYRPRGRRDLKGGGQKAPYNPRVAPDGFECVHSSVGCTLCRQAQGKKLLTWESAGDAERRLNPNRWQGGALVGKSERYQQGDILAKRPLFKQVELDAAGLRLDQQMQNVWVIDLTTRGKVTGTAPAVKQLREKLAQGEHAEVELRLGDQQVMLTPAYTGQDRPELAYEDGLLLAQCLDVLPGAEIASLRLVGKKK